LSRAEIENDALQNNGAKQKIRTSFADFNET
jgi:hypothetical protein